MLQSRCCTYVCILITFLPSHALTNRLYFPTVHTEIWYYSIQHPSSRSCMHACTLYELAMYWTLWSLREAHILVHYQFKLHYYYINIIIRAIMNYLNANKLNIFYKWIFEYSVNTFNKFFSFSSFSDCRGIGRFS